MESGAGFGVAGSIKRMGRGGGSVLPRPVEARRRFVARTAPLAQVLHQAILDDASCEDGGCPREDPRCAAARAQLTPLQALKSALDEGRLIHSNLRLERGIHPSLSVRSVIEAYAEESSVARARLALHPEDGDRAGVVLGRPASPVKPLPSVTRAHMPAHGAPDAAPSFAELRRVDNRDRCASHRPSGRTRWAPINARVSKEIWRQRKSTIHGRGRFTGRFIRRGAYVLWHRDYNRYVGTQRKGSGDTSAFDESCDLNGASWSNGLNAIRAFSPARSPRVTTLAILAHQECIQSGEGATATPRTAAERHSRRRPWCRPINPVAAARVNDSSSHVALSRGTSSGRG
jgi:hypothetical protein